MIDMVEMDNLVVCIACGVVIHLAHAKAQVMPYNGVTDVYYPCPVCKTPLNVKGKA